MSYFEVVMLICFGISWPISIIKALKTKVVTGKSPLFMAIVMTGYASGIMHKALFSRDWVIFLYATNFFLVGFDLLLFFYFSKKNNLLHKNI
ncbi:hypothetical protein QA601_02330 [Chitinispirillales bacterium ANBcel5]|uniref:hypothetical protein n=1 Tax=Cellulosispirillum alkaliphilum TaxID=3039283 RepID=UPI002A4F27C7|nr:hypothetical protein [Chitinispirillales bacterium ANBcel5]